VAANVRSLMNFSDRKATLSLQLAKAWFALSIIVAVYGILSDGVGWNAIDAIIPGVALIGLAYRYPWARFLVLGILLLQLAYFTLGAVVVTIPIAKSFYLDFVEVRPIPRTQMLLTRLLVLLVGPLKVGFVAWLFIDILRNERVKRYFVLTKELVDKEST
jgi:hypothetical protein